MNALIHLNPMVAAVLNTMIGYDNAAEVVKRASEERKAIRDITVELGYLSAEEADWVLDPERLTRPGVYRKDSLRPTIVVTSSEGSRKEDRTPPILATRNF